jgi:hypothetical protein
MYGGDIIAVLLKPDSTAPKQVEVSGYLTLWIVCVCLCVCVRA